MQHFSSTLALVAVTIVYEICLTSANKTVPCKENECPGNQICFLGKCIETYEYCNSKPCPSGYYCDDSRKCIKDTPCLAKCRAGEECYLKPVQCIRAPCPPQPSCRAKTCATIKCPDGQICENAKCEYDTLCPLTLCKPGTYCYKGKCLYEVPCKEGQCGPAEKCYIDIENPKVVCIEDKCAVVKCSAGYTCANGKCVKIPEECRTKPCRKGYYCDDYGKCIKDTPCVNKDCKPEEECFLQPVQCFVFPCPPVLSCRPKTCATVTCYHGEVCENGKCVPDNKCAKVLCDTGKYCYNGNCLSEVPCDGQCGSAEKCYVGKGCSDTSDVVCVKDRCALIRCRSGYKCVNGACIPQDKCS